MATCSLSALTSSLSSLSLSSSQINPKPIIQSLSFPQHKPIYLKSSKLYSPIVVKASADLAEADVDVDADVVAEDLVKLVKSRLPGGFAAQTICGTGRRKCAVARVVLKEGTGQVIINYRDAKDYLQGNPLWLEYVKTPLVTLGYETSYDIFVKAHGGGLSGQAQAISLGVARALLKVSPSYRPPLKHQGLLTRDSRAVERKKPGLHKARKRPQYSKR